MAAYRGLFCKVIIIVLPNRIPNTNSIYKRERPNEVKTNEQLHTLFTHVTKKCAEGGIIVMEDIDAMTHIVHKRSYFQNSYQSSVSSIDTDSVDSSTHDSCKYLASIKDDVLTLEFFLNILQGSLTSDDTIFITTTNHIEKLDPAFYRDGRFDVKIEMKAADHYQINEIFNRFFHRYPSPDIVARIPEYRFTPASFIARFRSFLLENTMDDESIFAPFMV